jgi:hypothetical protein
MLRAEALKASGHMGEQQNDEDENLAGGKKK